MSQEKVPNIKPMPNPLIASFVLFLLDEDNGKENYACLTRYLQLTQLNQIDFEEKK